MVEMLAFFSIQGQGLRPTSASLGKPHPPNAKGTTMLAKPITCGIVGLLDRDGGRKGLGDLLGSTVRTTFEGM